MFGTHDSAASRRDARSARPGVAALAWAGSPGVAGPTPSHVGVGNPAAAASIGHLMRLRSLAITGQVAAIATAMGIGVALPLPPMAMVVAGLVAWNAWTWQRMRSLRAADHVEIALHLGVDLGALSLLLYFSGGTANPFALLFVLHAVIIALLLPPRAAAFGIVLVTASYLVLGGTRRPLQMADGAPLSADLLKMGQALSFALTAAITAWFVGRIMATLRSHDRLLDEAAHKSLRDGAVLRVGALAAGAAHELATPLTTIAVVAEEIARKATTPGLERDARIVTAQISACRETIASLLAAAGHARSMGGGRERLDLFLEAVVERCRTMHPRAVIASDWRELGDRPQIYAEEMLRQALLALLNNAVDASPGDVRFSGKCSGSALELAIADRGRGVPDAELSRLGRAFFTTKPPGKGAGLGIVLATRAVEELGGRLRWENRAEGGFLVTMTLPLKALCVESAA